MTSPSSPLNSSSADSTDSVNAKPTRSSLEALPQLRPCVLQGPRFWIISALTITIVWLLIPLDTSISRWFTSLHIPGDIEKDMDAFQQFGQLGSVIFVIILILIMETPSIKRTVLDLMCASSLAAITSTFLKTMFGRARPSVSSEVEFFGPWFVREETFSLEWNSVASMPSGHSVAAAALAVYLAWIYPRLTVLVMVLAAMVATWRVRVSAHFPSDVVAGLFLGAIIATPVVRGHWGVRIIDFIWNRFVDTTSQRALPDVERALVEKHKGYKSRFSGDKSVLFTFIPAILGITTTVLIIANIAS